MEIHLPHGAAQSFREFALQLFTITIGILIALSLEGACEWNHHRQLAREARQNIAREIADNKKELDGEAAQLRARAESIDNVLRFADELLTKKETTVHQLDIGWSLATLNTASWQTADRTGALSYMDYDEVKEFASLYQMQQLFSEQQRQALPHISAALSVLAASGGDPHNLPPRQLELLRDHLLALKANVTVEEQFARPLLAGYNKALASGRR